MNESTFLKLLEALVHFKCLTYKQSQAIKKAWGHQRGQESSLSLYQFLLKRKNLAPGQLQKAVSLLQQGYYYCNSCTVIFPLPPGQKGVNRTCPQCNKGLVFYQSQSQNTPLTSPGSSQNRETVFPEKSKKKPVRAASPGSAKKLKGSQFPEYPIVKTLGQGGFGHVYQVLDSLSQRKMALKVLKPEAAKNFHTKQRFLREIQITSQLEHPCIMPVYESGYLENGSLYYVMKELRGGTLKDLMEKRKKGEEGAPDLREILEILLKVCDALEFAHSQGIIHRDLKPSNIAVGNFGEVMVLDWGIAKALGIDDPEMERPEGKEELIAVQGLTLTMGGILGTPGYMAPEQARGEEVTPASDIHAFGAMLYQILTHCLPYQGKPSAMVVRLLSQKPKDPYDHSPGHDIPIELASIAMKCLEKNPSGRYQGMGEVKEDLVRYLEGFSVSAHRDNLAVAASKWIRRNKALTGGLILACLVAVASLILVQVMAKRKIVQKVKGHLEEATEILNRKKLLTAEGLEKKYSQVYTLSRHETAEARRERQSLLKTYMKARKNLEKAHELTPANEEIQKKLFDTERNIGRLALLGGNYLLAETSFEKCARLNPKKGQILLTSLARQKKKTEEAHLQRLSEIMTTLKSSPPEPGMTDEYITEIVRMGTPEVVRRLLAYVTSQHLWPRKIAIEALGKIGDRHTEYKGKDVVETLIDRLDSLSVKDHQEECELLIWALGRLRDSRANEIVNKKRWKEGHTSPFWERTKVPFGWLPEKNKSQGKTYLKWQKSGSRKVAKGLYRGAVKDFTRALKLQSRSSYIYHTRAIAYSKLKEYEQALSDYNQALKLNPQYTAVYSSRGLLYKKLKEYDKALADYTQAIKINPQLASAYNNRGVLFHELKEYDKALKDFNRALKLNPQYASAYNNRGNLFQELKEYKKALKDFNQVIKLNPQKASAYNNRAVLFQKLKEYNKALADYSQALKLNPQFAKAYHNRAVLFKELKEYKKALTDYSQAIKLNPQYASAYNNRGNLFQELKKYKKALADFNQAIKLNSQNIHSYYNRANLFKELKEYKKALADYNQVIKLNSQYVPAYNNRAILFLILKEYDKALADFNQAIKLNPQNTLAYHNRGLLFEGKRRYQEAISDYTRYIELSRLDSQKCQGYVKRAKCWYHLKETKRAAEDLKMVLKLNPNHPKKKYFRRFIQKYDQ